MKGKRASKPNRLVLIGAAKSFKQSRFRDRADMLRQLSNGAFEYAYDNFHDGWHIVFRRNEEPDGYSAFKTFSEAKRALLKELQERNRSEDYSREINRAKRLEKQYVVVV
jgi:hypothetical protein